MGVLLAMTMRGTVIDACILTPLEMWLSILLDVYDGIIEMNGMIRVLR